MVEGGDSLDDRLCVPGDRAKWAGLAGDAGVSVSACDVDGDWSDVRVSSWADRESDARTSLIFSGEECC